MRLAALAACVAALLAGGHSARAVDGGSLARANDRLARSTVGLGTIREGEQGLGLTRCSGVLVAPDLVLTASHCVQNDPLAALVVFYGGSRPVPPFYPVQAITRFGVQEGDAPDEFLARLQQLSLDTAVLKLASPARGRTPLRITSVGRSPLPSRLRLAGIGLSGEGAGTLKTVQLRPVLFTNTGLTIARAEGALICSGDSGGPVVADGKQGPVLWGVASAVLTRQPPCGDTVVIAPASTIFGR